MNCQSFETVVNDLARDQLIEAASREEAMLHSESCGICARRLSDERALTRKLQEFSSAHMTSLSPRLEETLLAEFRRQQNLSGNQETSYRRRYSLHGAIAAALLLAFAVVAYRAFLGDKPQQPVVVIPFDNDTAQPNVTNNTAPNTAVQPELKLAGTPQRQPHRRRVVARNNTTRRNNPINNSETVAANHVATEVVSEFIPIGYLTAASVEEGAQLLRVEMPRSAMVRFGLPVNMERYNERVKADVLVSADGMARAIRFVQ